MTRDEAIARLRAHLPALRAEGVRGVSLFGSTARDEAGQDSDVDVLLDIDFQAKPKFDLFDLVGITQQLEHDLGLPVHAFIAQGLKDHLRKRIESDLIPIT